MRQVCIREIHPLAYRQKFLQSYRKALRAAKGGRPSALSPSPPGEAKVCGQLRSPHGLPPPQAGLPAMHASWGDDPPTNLAKVSFTNLGS
jgi:hypothetical protein